MFVTTTKRGQSLLGKAVAAMATATVAAAMMSAPAAASPQGDIFNMLNDAHKAAGCPAYGTANALGEVALQYTKGMVAFNGKKYEPSMSFTPSTKDLLEGRGYFTGGWGELNYFNNKGGGSASNAVNFWKGIQAWGLIKECGLSQLGVAVWINGNNWAASAILGQPVSPPAQTPSNVH